MRLPEIQAELDTYCNRETYIRETLLPLFEGRNEEVEMFLNEQIIHCLAQVRLRRLEFKLEQAMYRKQ